MTDAVNRRILLVDDMASIHDDFRKILVKKDDTSAAVDDAMAALLGKTTADEDGSAAGHDITFDIESAMQGMQAAELVKSACARKAPFALAFVDIRMPPGWDGVRTIEAIWELDKEIQTVICTAYSDYSWERMVERLGRSDRLLVLKKPFDPVEITQFAIALTEKWNIARREKALIEKLTIAEAEARAYAASLETVNHALVTAKAATDQLTAMKSQFLLRLSDEVNGNVESILGKAEELRSLDGDAPGVCSSIDTIISTSQRLMSMFHETLDVAMIETGRGANQVATIDPAALLREIVNVLAVTSHKNGLDVVLEIADGMATSIEVNPRYARQVFEELVRGAMEHTPSGSLHVKCGLELTDDWRRPRIRIEISSIGGVRDEDRGKVFDLFSRNPRWSREDTSSSLGLALAKRIADSLGWELHLDTAADGAPSLVLGFDVCAVGCASEPAVKSEASADPVPAAPA